MYELHHVGIVVSNLDTSVDFYTQQLGFSVLARDVNPVKRARAAMMGNGHFMIELIEYAEHLYDDIPVNHVAMRVDNVETAAAAFAAAGYELMDQTPRVIFQGRSRIMFLFGPDRERLELHEVLEELSTCPEKGFPEAACGKAGQEVRA